MVKIGFIAEGDSEDIFLKSLSFKSYLNQIGMDTSSELIINAEGKKKLYHPTGDFSKLKARVDTWLQTLYDKGVQAVFLLLDRDNDDHSYTQFKSKVYHHLQNVVIVATQELEAWYLADTEAMRKLLHKKVDAIKQPESYIKPIDEIIRLMQLHRNRGVPNKKILTNNMLRCNFSLAKAAAHPACPSAAYFQRKLMEAAQNR